jgi:hypothetical protein
MASQTEQTILQTLKEIQTQLASYPTPVAGCDEQFNYLLTERERLTKRLSQIGDGIHFTPPSPEPLDC